MTAPETIIGNARIVLADRIIDYGWVTVADGRIVEFGEGDAPAGHEDAQGDLIMPGLVDCTPITWKRITCHGRSVLESGRRRDLL